MSQVAVKLTFHVASEVDLDWSEVESLDYSKSNYSSLEAKFFDSSLDYYLFFKSILDCLLMACCFFAVIIDFEGFSLV